MKLVTLLLCATFLVASSPSSEIFESYTLQEAINKKFITVSVIATENSPHYVQPLTINISKKTPKNFLLRIPNGQIFNSVNPDIQDILTTQEELIAVNKEDISKELYGMCIQHGNRGPSNEEEYTVGEMAYGNLLAMSKEIEKKKSYNYIGQNALWSVSDKTSLAAIDSEDKETAQYFRTFTSKLLGVPEPDMEKLYAQETTITKKMGGSFKYKLGSDKPVTIGIFNDRNVVVREFYNNPEEKAGNHELKFEFNPADFTEDLYHVKLIVGGRVVISKKLKRAS